MPELANTRSGGKKFLDIAQTLCRIVQVSGPAIRSTYPSNIALLAALTAAEAVCPFVLPAKDEMQALDNADFVFDPSDAADIPGSIDPA